MDPLDETIHAIQRLMADRHRAGTGAADLQTCAEVYLPDGVHMADLGDGMVHVARKLDAEKTRGVLGVLGLKESAVPGLIDAWIEPTPASRPTAIVLAVMGGGRVSLAWAKLRAHALYLEDRDDQLDPTLSRIVFRLPPGPQTVQLLRELQADRPGWLLPSFGRMYFVT